MEKDVIQIPNASGDHIRDNYAVLEIELDDEGVDYINGFDDKVRVIRPALEEKVDSTPWE